MLPPRRASGFLLEIGEAGLFLSDDFSHFNDAAVIHLDDGTLILSFLRVPSQCGLVAFCACSSK